MSHPNIKKYLNGRCKKKNKVKTKRNLKKMMMKTMILSLILVMKNSPFAKTVLNRVKNYLKSNRNKKEMSFKRKEFH